MATDENAETILRTVRNANLLRSQYKKYAVASGFSEVYSDRIVPQKCQIIVATAGRELKSGYEEELDRITDAIDREELFGEFDLVIAPKGGETLIDILSSLDRKRKQLWHNDRQFALSDLFRDIQRYIMKDRQIVLYAGQVFSEEELSKKLAKIMYLAVSGNSERVHYLSKKGGQSSSPVSADKPIDIQEVLRQLQRLEFLGDVEEVMLKLLSIVDPGVLLDFRIEFLESSMSGNFTPFIQDLFSEMYPLISNTIGHKMYLKLKELFPELISDIEEGVLVEVLSGDVPRFKGHKLVEDGSPRISVCDIGIDWKTKKVLVIRILMDMFIGYPFDQLWAMIHEILEAKTARDLLREYPYFEKMHLEKISELMVSDWLIHENEIECLMKIYESSPDLLEGKLREREMTHQKAGEILLQNKEIIKDIFRDKLPAKIKKLYDEDAFAQTSQEDVSSSPIVTEILIGAGVLAVTVSYFLYRYISGDERSITEHGLLDNSRLSNVCRISGLAIWIAGIWGASFYFNIQENIRFSYADGTRQNYLFAAAWGLWFFGGGVGIGGYITKAYCRLLLFIFGRKVIIKQSREETTYASDEYRDRYKMVSWDPSGYGGYYDDTDSDKKEADSEQSSSPVSYKERRRKEVEKEIDRIVNGTFIERFFGKKRNMIDVVVNLTGVGYLGGELERQMVKDALHKLHLGKEEGKALFSKLMESGGYVYFYEEVGSLSEGVVEAAIEAFAIGLHSYNAMRIMQGRFKNIRDFDIFLQSYPEKIKIAVYTGFLSSMHRKEDYEHVAMELKKIDAAGVTYLMHILEMPYMFEQPGGDHIEQIYAIGKALGVNVLWDSWKKGNISEERVDKAFIGIGPQAAAELVRAGDVDKAYESLIAKILEKKMPIIHMLTQSIPAVEEAKKSFPVEVQGEVMAESIALGVRLADQNIAPDVLLYAGIPLAVKAAKGRIDWFRANIITLSKELDKQRITSYFTFKEMEGLLNLINSPEDFAVAVATPDTYLKLVRRKVNEISIDPRIKDQFIDLMFTLIARYGLNEEKTTHLIRQASQHINVGEEAVYTDGYDSGDYEYSPDDYVYDDADLTWECWDTGGLGSWCPTVRTGAVPHLREGVTPHLKEGAIPHQVYDHTEYRLSQVSKQKIEELARQLQQQASSPIATELLITAGVLTAVILIGKAIRSAQIRREQQEAERKRQEEEYNRLAPLIVAKLKLSGNSDKKYLITTAHIEKVREIINKGLDFEVIYEAEEGDWRFKGYIDSGSGTAVGIDWEWVVNKPESIVIIVGKETNEQPGRSSSPTS
ncbi:MAG: hypothetical protein NT066_06880, partial [Candidatus Omnitrophica bacterium]|nr:hypothetical protein [Candidatus Omnitrophota bacterium]